MKFEYHTEGTCSRNIILEMDGDTTVSYTHLTLPTTPYV